MLDIIHTGKFRPAETHLELVCHDASKNITLADKVCNKCVHRLIVYILGRTDLLDYTVVHNNNTVAHGQSLFLVMGDVYKSNSQFFLQTDELILHVLTQF